MQLNAGLSCMHEINFASFGDSYYLSMSFYQMLLETS